MPAAIIITTTTQQQQQQQQLQPDGDEHWLPLAICNGHQKGLNTSVGCMIGLYGSTQTCTGLTSADSAAAAAVVITDTAAAT